MLVHGFGGNCDHWRKNIGPLADRGFRVFSIDLLGYGYSDKPCPKQHGEPNALYNFYTWADQLNAFVEQVVVGSSSSNSSRQPRGPGTAEPSAAADQSVVLCCNSVGSCAGLQAIADQPSGGAGWAYKGIMLLNPSLRLLHTSKQSPITRPLVKLFQDFLRETRAGDLFFSQVAQAPAIEKILKEAYCDPAADTPELVQAVLQPGLEPGASRVFLDFISYSGGPLPEELIPRMPVPVDLVWGQEDPWEPIEAGRAEYAGLATVREFRALPGVGHCPMDEAPHLVNPIIADFASHVTATAAPAPASG